jgi:hypothetical protein
MGVIKSWLDTPVHLSDFLGGEDLPEDSQDDPLVIRTVTCMKQVWSLCLGGDDRSMSPMKSLEIQKALDLLPGWSKGRDRFPGLDQQRSRIRPGLKPFERKRQYKIVPPDDDLSGLL